MGINDNSQSRGKGIWIIVGIVILVVAFVLIFVGWKSISKFIFIILEILAFLGLIAMVVYAIWYFFIKQHKYDINYVNKQRIIKSATLGKYGLLKDLYLSGDRGHARVKIGKIKGYTRMRTLTRIYQYEDRTDEETGVTSKVLVTRKNKKGDDVPVYTLDKLEVDCFVLGNKGILGRFQEPEVIRVSPDDHSSLIGDVDVYCFSLIPISCFLFPNSDLLDERKISYALMKEAEQILSFVVLSQIRDHVNFASGIDSNHVKSIEKKQLSEIPEFKQSPSKDPYN